MLKLRLQGLAHQECEGKSDFYLQNHLLRHYHASVSGHLHPGTELDHSAILHKRGNLLMALVHPGWRRPDSVPPNHDLLRVPNQAHQIADGYTR